MEDKLCFFCHCVPDGLCECGLAYCNLHKQIHKPGDYCFPFKVSEREGVGRFLVATRDIRPLELVLWDKAAVVGPGPETLPVCVQCLVRLTPDHVLCSSCNLPLCGAECMNKKEHNDECQIFSKDRFKDELILLLLFTLVYLYIVLQDRFKDDPSLLLMFTMISKFFLDELNLTWTNTEEIHHIVGVLMTNGFENDYNGTTARALYPTLSLASHSCIANLRHAVVPGKQVALQAQDFIAKGTELCIRYTHLLQTSLKRRTQIKNSWYFDCTCARCTDPTEFGTLASSVYCPLCRVGLMLPQNSLQYSINFLTKYKSLLPPSNCYIVISKRYIHASTGNSPDSPISSLRTEELEDKIRFYRSFLRYLGNLDPGYSQHSALATLELSKAEVELFKREMKLEKRIWIEEEETNGENGIKESGKIKSKIQNFLKHQMFVQTQAHRCLRKVGMSKANSSTGVEQKTTFTSCE
ncbi:protein msta [Eurytemora carolleeae]|uniref:protein msta n=1 Tax=Eurytemora carolleeae TaxID=1294199 RepID=UPI000C76B9BB|nr:protein msta [Eurytemora carolleeae]|eukprot:XP_023321991.1 protein msta-like [Eurytemora affinis]